MTSSKTGIHNPTIFLEKRGLSLDEAIYVTRPYITRHGNGPLPCEVKRSELPGVREDLTNQPNEWQGILRYARHKSLKDFFESVLRDRDSVNDLERKEQIKTKEFPKLSILVTQLSETANQLYFDKGNIPFESLQKAGEELGIQCILDTEWR